MTPPLHGGASESALSIPLPRPCVSPTVRTERLESWDEVLTPLSVTNLGLLACEQTYQDWKKAFEASLTPRVIARPCLFVPSLSCLLRRRPQRRISRDVPMPADQLELPLPNDLEQAPSAPPVMTSPGPAFPIDEDTRDVGRFIWDSTSDDVNKLLANWMATSAIRPQRIWDICMPGTHNSATWDVAHTESNRALMKFALLFIKCQDKTVYQQLRDGVRFLDLRVGRNVHHNLEPICAHGGYRTVSLIEVYKQIAQFLSEHPTEVVLLSVRRDAGFRKGLGAIDLCESDFWVALYLGQFLGPKLRSSTTVDDLISRRQQVIYFYAEVERYLPPQEFKLQTLRQQTMARVKAMTRVSMGNIQAMDSVINAAPIPRNVQLKDLSPPGPEGGFQGAYTPQIPVVQVDSASPSVPEGPLTPLELPAPSPDVLGGLTASKNEQIRLRLQIEELINEALAAAEKQHKKDKHSVLAPSTLIMRSIEEQIRVLEGVNVEESRSIEGRFELSWAAGAVVYAAPEHHKDWAPPEPEGVLSPDIIKQAQQGDAESAGRFGVLPEMRPIKLAREDAKRFRAVGLTKEFFLHPLVNEFVPDFVYVSPFKTGRTLIEKSWGQTCESNPRFLIQKLRFWTAVHGSKPHRPPYRFRVLAGEVTPPSFAFPQTGTEIMKFWAGQSAATLLLLPSGLKVSAEAANRLMVTELFTREVISRLNVVTHDFCATRLTVTILFLHMKYLSEMADSLQPLTPVKRRKESSDAGVSPETEKRIRREMTAVKLAEDVNRARADVLAGTENIKNRRTVMFQEKQPSKEMESPEISDDDAALPLEKSTSVGREDVGA